MKVNTNTILNASSFDDIDIYSILLIKFVDYMENEK